VPPCARDVLDFWFGPADDPGHLQMRAQWFRKDEAFDASILERFGTLIDKALIGEIDTWVAPPLTALPALAQVVVLDQFTRNAFRNSARMYAGDAMALQSARTLVASGLDRQLSGVQRLFVYLPFEHAEDLAHQRTSVQLFEQLGRDEPALAGLLDWAQRHHDVVERFGRFPHRNALLGRRSSVEELEFLRQPGSSF
jgi:uncharacterized protein (DUF924 family)